MEAAETHQVGTIGDVQTTFTACASGSSGCADLGHSQIPAFPGTGQILIGALVPARVGLPATFTTTGPEALAFSESPSYTSELQRLSPAETGYRWAGYISPVTSYASDSGPQSLSGSLSLRLGQSADGSPFVGPLAADLVIGARQVSPDFPATRPVACGPSLRALFDEDPAEVPVSAVICNDDTFDFLVPTRDLGIFSGRATDSALPGTLATLLFTLRYSGLAGGPGAIYGLTATSTLTGAELAVTPGTVAPATDSTSQALVAVGVPAGAQAGTYDVTLTARLANGQARTAVGRLAVLGGGGGVAGGGGGRAARLRISLVLPKRLSLAQARTRGIAVLIGASQATTARVRLLQGRARKPKASKRVRLRAPGPTKVVLRSAKLVTGPYRIVITADGRRFVRRATLAR